MNGRTTHVYQANQINLLGNAGTWIYWSMVIPEESLTKPDEATVVNMN